MSEQEIAVYNQSHNAQDKYTYFLLAVVGAAVALALRETAFLPLAWSEVPLGAAVLCWALSFYRGCRHIDIMTSTVYSNSELLKVQTGKHPYSGTDPERMEIGVNVLRDVIDRESTNATKHGKKQFQFLILGAIFYIAWHIWEMWVRTPHTLPRL